MTLREKDCNRFLLVEGYSDLTFLAEMLEHLGIGPSEGQGATPVFIKEFSGKADLLDQIESWLTPKKLYAAKAIGIVVDADTSTIATRQSLVGRLQRSTGLALPRDGGWAAHAGGARLGFHVVPGQGPDDQGEIETLAWRSLHEDSSRQPTLDCVESFLAQRRSLQGPVGKPDKARVAAFLSTLTPEDPRLGPGARAKHFPFDARAFAPLRDFLLGMKGL